MKEKESVFDRYLMSSLDPKDLEGIRFLDPRKEEDLKIDLEIEIQLEKHFNSSDQEKRLLNSLSKIRAEKKQQKQVVWLNLMQKYSGFCATVCLLIVATGGFFYFLGQGGNGANYVGCGLGFKDQKSFANCSQRKSKKNIEGSKKEGLRYSFVQNSVYDEKRVAERTSNVKLIKSISVESTDNTLNAMTSIKSGVPKNSNLIFGFKKMERIGLKTILLQSIEPRLSINSENFYLASRKKEGKDYSKILELVSGNFDAYFERVELYLENGRLRRAEKDLSRLLVYHPTCSRAYLLRACVYQKRGKYIEAEKGFNKALRFRNVSSDYYVYRGLFYEEIGEPEKAGANFSVAIDLTVNSTTAVNKVISFVERMGENKAINNNWSYYSNRAGYFASYMVKEKMKNSQEEMKKNNFSLMDGYGDAGIAETDFIE